MATATVTYRETDPTAGARDVELTLTTTPLTRSGCPLLLAGDWAYQATDPIDPSLGPHRNAAHYLYHVLHVVNAGSGARGDMRIIQDFLRTGLEAR